MEKENHIQFKTRGDSTNQGKPRVYFCCHPDDFDMYFEPVRNEILDKQNCAVWVIYPVNKLRVVTREIR